MSTSLKYKSYRGYFFDSPHRVESVVIVIIIFIIVLHCHVLGTFIKITYLLAYKVEYNGRLVRNTMFTESNGDRSYAPNFIVLITDGRSDDRNLTWHEAMAARVQAITLLAVCYSRMVMISCLNVV